MQVYVIDVASGATQEMVTSREDKDQAGQYSMQHVLLPIAIQSMQVSKTTAKIGEKDDLR